MTRIYVNFDGLQDLEAKMFSISDQVNNLQKEIIGAINRWDWEVSQKQSIDEQISKARIRAARLADRSEHMLRFVKRASADFMKTDLRCANDHRNLNGYLDSVWKGFLSFGSRLFNDIGSCGMDLISALRQAGFYFMDRVAEYRTAHLGHINTALAVTSLGVAPLGSYELNGELRGRINAILAGTGSANKQEDEKDTGLLNSINDDYIVPTIEKYIANPVVSFLDPGNTTMGALSSTGKAVVGAFAFAGMKAFGAHEIAFSWAGTMWLQGWAVQTPLRWATSTGVMKGAAQQFSYDLASNKLSPPWKYLESMLEQGVINGFAYRGTLITSTKSTMPIMIESLLKNTGSLVLNTPFNVNLEAHKAMKKNPIWVEQIMFKFF